MFWLPSFAKVGKEKSPRVGKISIAIEGCLSSNIERREYIKAWIQNDKLKILVSPFLARFLQKILNLFFSGNFPCLKKIHIPYPTFFILLRPFSYLSPLRKVPTSERCGSSSTLTTSSVDPNENDGRKPKNSKEKWWFIY